MKKSFFTFAATVLLTIGLVTGGAGLLCAEEAAPKTLDDMTVTAQRIDVVPNKTEVFIEDYNIAGTLTNVFDILRDRAMIDFRGQSDLVPESGHLSDAGI